MKAPLHFMPWPAPQYLAASSPGTVYLACRRHGTPYHIDPMQELLFGHLIVAAYMKLPDIVAAMASGGIEAAHRAMCSAGPLCCALGSEKVDEICRGIPAIWALRS